GIDCSMAAVLGANHTDLINACKEASSVGIVEIANYNSPSQQVIGGETAAVKRASEILLNLGAKRVVPLNVSGAFHTSLMKKAGDSLREKFKEIEFKEMKIPVIFNATADTLKVGEAIPQLLEKQVQSSVFFEDSIKKMECMGIDTIVEIGPGKVLSGFVRKTSKNIKCFNIEDIESLNKTMDALKGE
ncbi:MAG: ACP S-malonyltransferase, partial [Oscillospiraceae bacterium]